MYKLSPQQAAVIDWVRDGSGSAFVEAVAGSGKTTTLIAACQETSGSVAFAAYNKKIADEIKGKVARLNVGNRIRVGTFHSFGFSALRYVFKEVKVDSKLKAERLIERCLTEQDRRDGLSSLTLKLVSLAKQRALGLVGSIDDDARWFDIVEHFALDHEVEHPELIPVAIDRAKLALRDSIEMSQELIDFDDMIYVPVIKGIKVWENDWVFVDEAQDTNPARRALARKMLKRGGTGGDMAIINRTTGRAVFVGDRHQAIYGFTGADNDAVDQIVRDFNCIQLPLTVTFRCPKKVTEAAREYVSHIEAHESAPEGVVRAMTAEELDDSINLKAFHPTRDAILCRNTKPLVACAYQMIRRGVACHVEGRDIGAGLIALINRFKAKTMNALLKKLDAYYEREVEKLIAKGRETQAQALEDRIDTIRVLAENCQSVDELRQKIEELFIDGDQERKPTLTLSTVHKAKGREWDRVLILGRQLMPSRWARQSWQQEQERNLIYVAYTRAQKELCIINAEAPVAASNKKEAA